jgi:hypothetical protein
MVVHTCNQQAEAGGLPVQSQHGLHRETVSKQETLTNINRPDIIPPQHAVCVLVLRDLLPSALNYRNSDCCSELLCTALEKHLQVPQNPLHLEAILPLLF